MISFTLNGADVTLDLPDHASLLHALRGPLGLSSPRFGCGAEQCGSCMVLLDGKPAYACALGIDAVAGRIIVTVEGLGSAEAPHPLQTAFVAEQAGQCGYCLSGMLISATALLVANPDPDEDAIRTAMEPHLCRCGSHNRIIRAIRRAAQEMAA
jgi:nicotinate dehydrogenase subunit A